MTEETNVTLMPLEIYSALKKHDIRLVLAFPGTGKTTCVKLLRTLGRGPRPMAADFDIKGIGNDRSDISQFPSIQARMGDLVNEMMKEGIIVFSFMNYFDFQSITKDNGKILVAIPDATPYEWAARVGRRGDSMRFVNLIYNHLKEWQLYWLKMINVLRVQMGLDVGLVRIKADQYLSDVLRDLGDEFPVYDVPTIEKIIQCLEEEE